MVAEPEGKTVGTLDEDFAMESLTGDVFLLGTHSWRIRHVDAGHACTWKMRTAPRPRFRSGSAKRPGRSTELSAAVSPGAQSACSTRSAANGCSTSAAWTKRARSRRSPTCARARPRLGALPSTDTVVAERFFDEAGGMQLVLHAPFGSRINRAWGLALRKRFCRTFNFELQAAATDNGIVISLSDRHAFPLELVFEFLNAETVRDVLTQAMLDAPMFGARWRWNATRALAILRFRGGTKVPAPIQRMRSDDLLGAVFPGPGGVRGKPHRTDPHSRSSAGERDDRQLPA